MSLKILSKRMLSMALIIAFVLTTVLVAVPVSAVDPIDDVRYSVSINRDKLYAAANTNDFGKIEVTVSVTFDGSLTNGTNDLGYLGAGIGYDSTALELVDTLTLTNSIEVSDDFIAGFGGTDFATLYGDGSDGDIIFDSSAKVPADGTSVAKVLYSTLGENVYPIADNSSADKTVEFATFTFKALTATAADTLLWLDDVTCVAGEGAYGEGGTAYADYEISDGVGLPAIDDITILSGNAKPVVYTTINNGETNEFYDFRPSDVFYDGVTITKVDDGGLTCTYELKELPSETDITGTNGFGIDANGAEGAEIETTGHYQLTVTPTEGTGVAAAEVEFYVEMYSDTINFYIGQNNTTGKYLKTAPVYVYVAIDNFDTDVIAGISQYSAKVTYDDANLNFVGLELPLAGNTALESEVELTDFSKSVIDQPGEITIMFDDGVTDGVDMSKTIKKEGRIARLEFAIDGNVDPSADDVVISDAFTLSDVSATKFINNLKDGGNYDADVDEEKDSVGITVIAADSDGPSFDHTPNSGWTNTVAATHTYPIDLEDTTGIAAVKYAKKSDITGIVWDNDFDNDKAAVIAWFEDGDNSGDIEDVDLTAEIAAAPENKLKDYTLNLPFGAAAADEDDYIVYSIDINTGRTGDIGYADVALITNENDIKFDATKPTIETVADLVPTVTAWANSADKTFETSVFTTAGISGGASKLKTTAYWKLGTDETFLTGDSFTIDEDDGTPTVPVVVDVDNGDQYEKVSFRFEDQAGNITHAVVNLKIDRKAPTVVETKYYKPGGTSELGSTEQIEGYVVVKIEIADVGGSGFTHYTPAAQTITVQKGGTAWGTGGTNMANTAKYVPATSTIEFNASEDGKYFVQISDVATNTAVAEAELVDRIKGVVAPNLKANAATEGPTYGDMLEAESEVDTANRNGTFKAIWLQPESEYLADGYTTVTINVKRLKDGAGETPNDGTEEYIEYGTDEYASGKIDANGEYIVEVVAEKGAGTSDPKYYRFAIANDLPSITYGDKKFDLSDFTAYRQAMLAYDPGNGNDDPAFAAGNFGTYGAFAGNLSGDFTVGGMDDYGYILALVKYAVKPVNYDETLIPAWVEDKTVVIP